MKSIRSIIYIAVIIGVLLLVKYFFFPSGQNEAAGPPGMSMGKDGKPIMPPSLVGVFVVEPTSMNNNLFATGTIVANEMVDLKPEIAGKVSILNINEGQAVRKGQLLVKLNDADLQAQFLKVQAQIKLADEKLNRYQQLLKIQGVSQEEYDAALNQLGALKADAEVLKVQIGRCSITAPFDGVLGLRNISIGSYITPQQIVTTIQQLNPVKIDFSIPERYAAKIHTGSTINFTVEGNANKYQGTVYAVEPGIDVASRALKMRARANNSSNTLKPGAFAKIELILGNDENAIMIPTMSVVPVLKGQQVFVCKNGKSEAVPVETGLRTEKMVQIISGLSKGDSVVTTGIMGLRPGASLKIIK
jgi:membrane fusion protein (multidrug efflux system)